MTAALSLGVLLIRLAVGLTVAGHGAQKLFGWFDGPGIAGFTGMMEKLEVRPARHFALLAGLGEFGGGILVALGLFSPAGPLIVAAGMVVAIVTVHLAKGFWSTRGGYEYPLLVLVTSLALSITGPGAYSIDAATRLSLPEPASWIVLAVIAFGGSVAALGSRRLSRRRLEIG
jgi:putative oxidoreductase